MQTENLLNILDCFLIEEKVYQLKSINQGFINDTFLVIDNGQPIYILQKVNTDVFTDIDGLMNNMQQALSYLGNKQYSKITLVKSKTNKYFINDYNGKSWRLMTYIDGSTAYDTTNDKKIAFEAGKIIGIFHQLLQDSPKESFVDTIPQFHDLNFRETQFFEALEKAPINLIDQSLDAISFAKAHLPQLKEWNKLNNLPIRVCHNDTKLNNILYSKTDRKALCLIDLDTLMCGYFHYDFGDAIRTIVNAAPEDTTDLNAIQFDKNLFTAFVNGIKSNGNFLTPEEINMLPYGVILMPFLHGIRALTDYLNGNKYYKVAYENQNLNRSFSLFDFTNKAMNELDFMKTVVKELN